MSKRYLIIGGSSDVGVELIKEINLREQDSEIIAQYNTSDEKIKAIIPANNNKISTKKCDLSQADELAHFVDELKDGEPISAVVHLAAPKLEFTKLKNLSWGDCKADADVQVGSILSILQGLLPKMLKSEERAKVVFMLSENTLDLPAKYSTKYTMSKYMMLGLMKSLTAEYEGKNINFNALSPTMIDTKLLSNIDRRLLEFSGATANMLMPADVVPTILMLLSGESDELFGENIHVEKVH